jgi:hypothetical protein
MTRTLRWVGTQVRECSNFYVLNDLEEFSMKFEVDFMVNQRLPALYISLKSTPTRWWGTHKENINNWFQCKRLLRIRFDAKHKHRYEDKNEGFGQPQDM